MALDSKVLRAAKKEYEEMLRRNRIKKEKIKAELYAANPRVEELDKQLVETVTDALGIVFKKGGDAAAEIEKLSKHSRDIQDERDYEIREAGFDPETVNSEYMCPICHDTGYTDKGICSCLKNVYIKEQLKELSRHLNVKDETFDTFDLDYYSDKKEPTLACSPRANMEMIKEMCFRYAERFGPGSRNLFLNGTTGLGKTFLSACIAKVVTEKGFSVVYESAVNLFDKFEKEHFNKAEDLEAVREDIDRYMKCDLLIIDDLGTEMSTALTQSMLYNLMNTRLTDGKKTIINSNLKNDELRRRYSGQVVSRLLGDYDTMTFYGSDIRLQKKNLNR